MSGPLRWSEKYLGVPFTPRGFDFTGCHCWGLICLVYKHECQIVLPEYAISADEMVKAARKFRDEQGGWVEIPFAARRVFDLLLMTAEVKDGGRTHLLSGHIGVLSGRSHVLHVERDQQTVNTPLNHSLMTRRIMGVFRHPEMVNAHLPV